MSEVAKRAAAAPKSWLRERAAQEAYAVLVAAGFPPADAARQAFGRRFDGTRYGRALQ